MNAWWIIGISFAVAVAILVGYVVWFTLRYSPSRNAVRAMRGTLQAASDAMEQASRCPVCGEPRVKTGSTHRFQIDDDVRMCWTP